MKCSELVSQVEAIMAEAGDIEIFADIENEYGDLSSVVVEESADGEVYATIKADAVVDEELESEE